MLNARLLGNRCGLRCGLRCDSQQFFRFGAEAAKFVILRGVLVHPLDALLVPLACSSGIAEPFVGHGQEKEVKAVAAVARSARFLQVNYSALKIAGAITGDAKRVPD